MGKSALSRIELDSFAAACFDDNTIAELEAALQGPADKGDCDAWGLTPTEWREQIKLALEAKTEELISETPTMNAEQIKSELAGFTGTDHWYRHPLVRSVTYTDGVKHFAEIAGAYWLLDILATELPSLVRKHDIIFVTATAKDGKAKIEAVKDTGLKPLWSRDIDFTDLPDGEYPLWMGLGGPGETIVIMLPSEY